MRNEDSGPPPTELCHSDDYHRVETAIRFIENHFRDQPSLDDIAASVHLSKYHFERLFKRWAGVSPKRFLQHITLDHTKRQLAAAHSLQEASLNAGLSGTGRLHDLFVSFEAMTPGEYKRKGLGLAVTYGFGVSPFGTALLASTPRGICHLGFVDGDARDEAVADLMRRIPHARFTESGEGVQEMVDRIFNPDGSGEKPFHLHVRGTNFQINVWKALLRIPQGTIVSYSDVAAAMGQPRAFRAVANAVAANPVGYLIPCHRVITSSGTIHRYFWGTARKKAIIGWEAGRSDLSPAV